VLSFILHHFLAVKSKQSKSNGCMRKNIIVVFFRIVTLEKTIEDKNAEILAVRNTQSASRSKDER